jgi:hypothetical protein
MCQVVSGGPCIMCNVTSGVFYGVYSATNGMRWPLWSIQCDKWYWVASMECRMQHVVSCVPYGVYNATGGIRWFLWSV